MGRSTQYIGLTYYAHEWVKDALRVETYEMTTGMFDELVMGRIFHMSPPEGPNKARIAKEVVQDTPWSSGPMIFTHLQMTLVKESGQEIDEGFVHSWVIAPELYGRAEYDRKTGRYYV